MGISRYSPLMGLTLVVLLAQLTASCRSTRGRAEVDQQAQGEVQEDSFEGQEQQEAPKAGEESKASQPAEKSAPAEAPEAPTGTEPDAPGEANEQSSSSELDEIIAEVDGEQEFWESEEPPGQAGGYQDSWTMGGERNNRSTNDSTLCGRAEANLKRLNCKDEGGRPIWKGDGNDRYQDRCKMLIDDIGVFLNPGCLAKAKTCNDAAKCSDRGGNACKEAEDKLRSLQCRFEDGTPLWVNLAGGQFRQTCEILVEQGRDINLACIKSAKGCDKIKQCMSSEVLNMLR